MTLDKKKRAHMKPPVTVSKDCATVGAYFTAPIRISLLITAKAI